jgi:sigma-B regulation protein RsbU (phosphoserine phosphatase)
MIETRSSFETRLQQVIMENRHLPAAELPDKILTAISAFAGNHPQHDDITIMIMSATENS